MLPTKRSRVKAMSIVNYSGWESKKGFRFENVSYLHDTGKKWTAKEIGGNRGGNSRETRSTSGGACGVGAGASASALSGGEGTISRGKKAFQAVCGQLRIGVLASPGGGANSGS